MWWLLVALFVYLWATLTIYFLLVAQATELETVWPLFLWPIFPILAMWE